MKGVKKETIAKVLSETKVDEEKVASELLRKKMYKWKNLPPREARQKMAAFLARKGFDWDVIEKLTHKR
jgi:SOS response regulatory protein OraA/RecX